MAFESIDNVHGSYGLSLCVFTVSHGISDHVFEKNLQHSSCFFIDEAGYALDSSTTGETTDCGLCDSLDIVTKHL